MRGVTQSFRFSHVVRRGASIASAGRAAVLACLAAPAMLAPAAAGAVEDADAASAASADDAAAPDEEAVRGDPIRLGYIENVRVGNLGLSMKGKLDTGADSSSVYARDMELYDRKGKDTWVRFRLIGKNGRSVRYDQNVIRFVRIKLKRGGSIRRPVIHLPLCVGGRSGVAELNLADRSEFEYDILVGREFLANRIVVDSGKTFQASEECESADDA